MVQTKKAYLCKMENIFEQNKEEILKNKEEILKRLNNLSKASNFLEILLKIFETDSFSINGEIKNQHEYLNNNEKAFLLGLWIKNKNQAVGNNVLDIDSTISKITQLLREYHVLLSFENKLHEGIIYGGEAYDWDHILFFSEKYALDKDWILQNKDFNIDAIAPFFRVLKMLFHFKINVQKLPLDSIEIYKIYKNNFIFKKYPEFLTIIKLFAIGEKGNYNKDFQAIGDKNIFREKPIVEYNDYFFIPNLNLLAEAIYMAPYFWFLEDKTYHKASENRGTAAVDIVCNLLKNKFSDHQVYKNILVKDGKTKKANTITDLDVCLQYDNSLLVFSVKAKGLTQFSKQGFANNIKEDFEKAVIESYEKSQKLHEVIVQNKTAGLKDKNGNTVFEIENIEAIYMICIVLDHYPSVSFHANLHYRADMARNTKIIPMVLSIFDLKIFTHYLTADRFIDYIKKRYASSAQRFIDISELSFLQAYLDNPNIFDEFKEADGVTFSNDTQLFDDQYQQHLNKKELEQCPDLFSNIQENDFCFCCSGLMFKDCCSHIVQLIIQETKQK